MLKNKLRYILKTNTGKLFSMIVFEVKSKCKNMKLEFFSDECSDKTRNSDNIIVLQKVLNIREKKCHIQR